MKPEIYYCSLVLPLFFTVAVGDVCQAQYRVERTGDVAGGANSTAALSDDDTSNSRGSTTGLVTCPRPDDPPDFTACCYDLTDTEISTHYEDSLADVPRCCMPQEIPRLFYFISDQLALLIAISLTVTLLIITVIIVVCCFWSRCPLYMACRVRYRQDDIIAYASKDDETANLNEMPPEERKGVTLYSPNAVKVTTLREEA